MDPTKLVKYALDSTVALINKGSEPTAALDSKSGRDVVNLMQKLAKEQNCAIVMVTHDNRVLDVADRIVYMEDGRLIKEVS